MQKGQVPGPELLSWLGWEGQGCKCHGVLIPSLAPPWIPAVQHPDWLTLKVDAESCGTF